MILKYNHITPAAYSYVYFTYFLVLNQKKNQTIMFSLINTVLH